MKNLKIFGDSIIKGVTYNGQSYHLCQEHDFDTLRAQGVTVENNAKMGATIDAGLKQLDRKLGACDSDTTVLFCFGGNDCDYDWKAISEDPDGEHLPHTPSEQFIDRYCTAIRKAQSAGARVAMTSLPPLEQERYFTFITRGLSAENILHWLGDTDHLYRWQEYYNSMVAQLSRAFGCRLVDLRAEFLKSRIFPTASIPRRPDTTSSITRFSPHWPIDHPYHQSSCVCLAENPDPRQKCGPGFCVQMGGLLIPALRTGGAVLRVW